MAEFDHMGHTTAQADLDVLANLAEQVETNHRASNARGPFEAVELGTWAGLTALVLERYFDRVYCVDHWQGSPTDGMGVLASRSTPEALFARFCANMGDKLYRSVVPCFGTSMRYAGVWPRQVDLVFVDADHRYEHCKRDIQLWLPHVLPGGYVVGHDWNNGFAGVDRAVMECFGRDFQHEAAVWWHRRPRRAGEVK